MEKFRSELEQACIIARKASRAILEIYYGDMDVSFKKNGTPVTNADIKANEIILEGLHYAFPYDGIVSEELESIQGERVWYVDPIDGTKGFTGRTDQFVIHIGLVEKESPVLGLVYKPTTGEYYYGVKGQGAYRVSPKGLEKRLMVDLTPGRVSTLITNKSFLLSEKGKNILERLNLEKVYISGSEGLRIMKIAEGTADGHILANPYLLSTWDVCAPQAIVEEAGGYVLYSDGTPVTYFGQKDLVKDLVVARTLAQVDSLSKILET